MNPGQKVAEVYVERRKINLLIIAMISLSSLLVNWMIMNPSRIDFKVFIIGILAFGFLHEALHTIAYLWWGQMSLREIRISFSWKHLTPYCSCSTPVCVGVMCKVLLLPLIGTGIVAFCLLLMHSSKTMANIVLVSLAFCTTDIWTLVKLRRFDRNLMVTGHPSKDFGHQLFTRTPSNTKKDHPKKTY